MEESDVEVKGKGRWERRGQLLRAILTNLQALSAKVNSLIVTKLLLVPLEYLGTNAGEAGASIYHTHPTAARTSHALTPSRRATHLEVCPLLFPVLLLHSGSLAYRRVALVRALLVRFRARKLNLINHQFIEEVFCRSANDIHSHPRLALFIVCSGGRECSTNRFARPVWTHGLRARSIYPAKYFRGEF